MEQSMAPDDRDRMFDKALSRHLRSMPSSPETSKISSDSTSSTSLCLDAEMLAAYHERSLLPEEMNSAKEHIVGCAHCQAILAQLELTDTIPLAAIEKEKMLATAAAPAAVVQEERTATSAQRAQSDKAASRRPIRGPRWHWLVPAGALAAGLLVWIGLHENQRPHFLGNKEVQVARVQEPPAPVPSLNKQTVPALTAPKAEQLDALSRGHAGVGGITGGAAGITSKAIPSSPENLNLPGQAEPATRVASSPALSAKESELRKDAARDSSVSLLTAQNQRDLDAKNATGGALQDQAALQNQNQAANIQVQNQMIQQKVAGPSPLSQVETAKKSKSATATARYSAAPAPAPPAPTAAAAFSDDMEMAAHAIPNQHLIAVPGTAVRWLAGGAGLIEFSSDNGSSWSVQSSGVTVDLLTGSAPSDKICWMVGRAGTILLTTDGGAHWSTVHSPLTEDLGGIHASDVLHATIWNLAKTKSFETSDGGVTWKPVAGQ
jgi:hypothetical protein